MLKRFIFPSGIIKSNGWREFFSVTIGKISRARDTAKLDVLEIISCELTNRRQ